MLITVSLFLDLKNFGDSMFRQIWLQIKGARKQCNFVSPEISSVTYFVVKHFTTLMCVTAAHRARLFWAKQQTQHCELWKQPETWTKHTNGFEKPHELFHKCNSHIQQKQKEQLCYGVWSRKQCF